TPESNTISLAPAEPFAVVIADLKDPVLPSSKVFVTEYVDCANDFIGQKVTSSRRAAHPVSFLMLIPHNRNALFTMEFVVFILELFVKIKFVFKLSV
ncbi:MAG: hypothetical protein QF732_12560, partial [Nitrospinaceae bacterium]|nr:hypothetical protein [Nitrospinaceae bacterium]